MQKRGDERPTSNVQRRTLKCGGPFPALRRWTFGVRRSTFTTTLIATSVAVSGCRYDTSAYRPPREAVSAIENLDLPERPPTSEEAAHVATLPTTLPATVPVAERTLTLQEVRELALRHNL